MDKARNVWRRDTCERCGARRTIFDDGSRSYDYPADRVDSMVLQCRMLSHTWPQVPSALKWPRN